MRSTYIIINTFLVFGNIFNIILFKYRNVISSFKMSKQLIVGLFALMVSLGNGADLCDSMDSFGTDLTSPPGISNVDIKIGIKIDCLLSMVNITFNIPANKWAGIVFGNSMSIPSGYPALIISSGKSGNDPIECQAYSLTANNGNGVNAVTNTYTTVINTDNDGERFILCSQSLSDTDVFSLDTSEVKYGVAWSQDSSTLQLGYHFSNRITPFTVDLLSGATFVSENRLPYIHGISMFIAWGLCAYIGIFSSANRHVFSKKAKWYLYHRVFQTLTLVFFIAGWIIMIIYKLQQQRNPLDFLSDPHQGIGFAVILIGILQPFNTLFRGTKYDRITRTKRRIIWEYIHKGLGYAALILAQIAIILGLSKYDAQLLMIIFIGYIAILAIIFALFKYRGIIRAEFIQPQSDDVSQIETTEVESSQLVSRHYI